MALADYNADARQATAIEQELPFITFLFLVLIAVLAMHIASSPGGKAER